ncbi:lysM domain receptor kinase [Trifolium repens]|nr:lysM domain receptor kinase [Trifolium repens]
MTPNEQSQINTKTLISPPRNTTDRVRASSDDFGRATAKIAVAQLCEATGFHAVKDSARESFSDIVIRYLIDFSKTAKFYSNLAGRSECSLFDLIRAWEDLEAPRGFSNGMKEIMNYAESMPEIPFAQPIPQFPVIRQRRIIPSFVQMGETPPSKHIPPWLPALPDPHTYIHTPVWDERVSDPRQDKVEQARQRRKAERSLLNLQKRLLLSNSNSNRNRNESTETTTTRTRTRSDPDEDAADVDVAPVVLPTKLPIIDGDRVSVLEAFAPAIEMLGGGGVLCDDDDEIEGGKTLFFQLLLRGLLCISSLELGRSSLGSLLMIEIRRRVLCTRYLWLVEKMKEMIRKGGLNIFSGSLWRIHKNSLSYSHNSPVFGVYAVAAGSTDICLQLRLKFELGKFHFLRTEFFIKDIIITNNKSKRVNVPFPCDCINGEFLAHTFEYQFQPGETYTSVAKDDFSNLTTDIWVQNFNIYRPTNIPDFGMINVSINCSCGNSKVSKDYGLFITYPLGSEDSLESIAKDTEIEADLLQRYNPGVNFSQGSGLVFIPGKDQNGSYMPLHSSTIGLILMLPQKDRVVAIVGISVGVLAGLLVLSICVYIKYYLKKKAWQKKNLILDEPNMNSDQTGTHITGIIVENSLEFSYQELCVATNNFSVDNKIGEGGFGEVFYADLRGQIAAVKKMKMKASKEFYAELKILSRVHHLNLVGLIGYCVEGCLFLVYEYIDNGNLSQNLRDLEREPLPWSTRMQIALDSARGLEYIHEHTVRAYIHRDIKSENIFLDKNFRAKVADFGLSKLAEVENLTSSAIVAEGTFGYMPPEYDEFLIFSSG